MNCIFCDELIEEFERENNCKVKNTFKYNFLGNMRRINELGNISIFCNIEELSLIGHQISDISNIVSLKKLKKLNLSWNSLNSFDQITHLPNLCDLSLDRNNISVIPDSISLLKSLMRLSLNYNPIKKNEIHKLSSNTELVSFDIRGTLVSEDESSTLFCIFTLPHITVLNRTSISQEQRNKSYQRFYSKHIENIEKKNQELEVQLEVYKTNLIINDMPPYGARLEPTELEKKVISLNEHVKLLQLENSSLKEQFNIKNEEIKVQQLIAEGKINDKYMNEHILLQGRIEQLEAEKEEKAIEIEQYVRSLKKSNRKNHIQKRQINELSALIEENKLGLKCSKCGELGIEIESLNEKNKVLLRKLMELKETSNCQIHSINQNNSEILNLRNTLEQANIGIMNRDNIISQLRENIKNLNLEITQKNIDHQNQISVLIEQYSEIQKQNGEFSQRIEELHTSINEKNSLIFLSQKEINHMQMQIEQKRMSSMMDCFNNDIEIQSLDPKNHLSCDNDNTCIVIDSGSINDSNSKAKAASLMPNTFPVLHYSNCSQFFITPTSTPIEIKPARVFDDREKLIQGFNSEKKNLIMAFQKEIRSRDLLIESMSQNSLNIPNKTAQKNVETTSLLQKRIKDLEKNIIELQLIIRNHIDVSKLDSKYTVSFYNTSPHQIISEENISQLNETIAEKDRIIDHLRKFKSSAPISRMVVSLKTGGLIATSKCVSDLSNSFEKLNSKALEEHKQYAQKFEELKSVVSQLIEEKEKIFSFKQNLFELLSPIYQEADLGSLMNNDQYPTKFVINCFSELINRWKTEHAQYIRLQELHNGAITSHQRYLLETEDRIQNYESKIKTINEKYLELSQNKILSKSNLSNSNDKLVSNLKKQIEEFQKINYEKQSHIIELQDQLSVNANRIEFLENSIKNLKDGSSMKDDKQKEFSELKMKHTEMKIEYSDSIEKMRNQIRILKDSNKQKSDSIKEMEIAFKQQKMINDSITTTFASLNDQFCQRENEIKEKIISLERENQSLRNQNNVYSQMINDLNSQKEYLCSSIIKKENQISEMATIMIKHENTISSLKEDLKGLYDMNHTLNESLLAIEQEKIQIHEKLEYAQKSSHENEISLSNDLNDKLDKEKKTNKSLVQKMEQMSNEYEVLINKQSQDIEYQYMQSRKQLEKRVRELENSLKKAMDSKETADYLFSSLTNKYKELQNQTAIIINENEIIKDNKIELANTILNKNEEQSTLIEQNKCLHAMIAENNEIIQSLNTNISLLQTENDTLKKQNSQLGNSFQEMEEKLTKKSSLEKDIMILEAEYQLKHENTLKNMVPLENYRKNQYELDKKTNEIQKLQNDNDSLRKRTEDLEDLLKKKDETVKLYNDEINSVKKQLNTMKKSFDSIKSEQEEQSIIHQNRELLLQKQITGLKNDKTSLETQILEIKADNDRLKTGFEEKSIRISDFSLREESLIIDTKQKEHLINTQKQLIESKDKEIIDLRSYLNTAESDNNLALSQMKKENRHLHSQINDLSQQLQDSASDNSMLRKQISEMVEKHKFEEICSQFDSLKELYRNEKDRLNNDIEQLKIALNSKETECRSISKKYQIQNEANNDTINRLQTQLFDETKIRKKFETLYLELKQQNTKYSIDLKTKETDFNSLMVKTEFLEKLESENNQKINELESKYQTVYNHIKNLHSILSRVGSRSKSKENGQQKIQGIVNSLFNMFSLDSISRLYILSPPNLSIVTQSLYESKPEVETLLAKQQRILNAVRKELMSFPNISTSVAYQSEDFIDNQLEQLHELVSRVKNLFIEREKHIEEMSALVSAQHQTVMMVSQNRNQATKSDIDQSFILLNKANRIVEKDRKNRMTISYSGN